MRSEFRHEPILVDAIVEALSPALGGVHVDLTAGGGGHLAEIAALPARGLVVGVDRDPEAIAWCRHRFAARNDVRVVEARWSGWLAAVTEAIGDLDAHGGLRTVLLDAGVSSVQIDSPERGFSFRREGPLDMRMSSEGSTALDLLEKWDVGELAGVLRKWGEVPQPGRFARAIQAAVEAGRLRTTLDLARVCEEAWPMGRRRGGGHPAAQVFQALRIAVNEELQELESALDQIASSLVVGGRVAVLTFHSLEDRIVKRRFRHWTTPRVPPRGVPVSESDLQPAWNVVVRRLGAGDEEVARNPRARSAWLRVVERGGAT